MLLKFTVTIIMDHLAQDLTIALEESESCHPISIVNSGKWGIRRRTRSAGNLHIYSNKTGNNHSDESSSSNSEIRTDKHRNKVVSFHQSDSDDMSFSVSVAKALSQKTSLRMRNPVNNFLRGVSHSLESDSVNEHSPARPNLRRKRKLKRMSIDETPIPPCGKRKRSQRLEIVDNGRFIRHSLRIKPLHQSLVDKIEKFCHPVHPNSSFDDPHSMEIQGFDDNCDVASESSISWSGGEGHEGDDELTDWAPPMDNPTIMDQQSWSDSDPREIRAGGGDHEYKKAEGKKHHSEHEGSHGEKGDKGYKGKHHNEKGEKGHHIKENHDKHYDEHNEHDKKHQHEDGYHAEHSHGEKGHKGSKFEENGEHHKGHNTKGVHNIHKTDEFEKKQEFYDESHEGGDSEKHGEYFHEDSYKKGGYEKGGHKKGANEEIHYGKKNKYEKGGHHKEDKGHSDAGGHEEHHAHVHKYGKKDGNSGGKKWKYKKGDGDDSHGKHSEQKQFVSKREEGTIHEQPKGDHKEALPSNIYEKNRILLSPMFIYPDIYNSKSAKIQPSNQNREYLVNEPENEKSSNREPTPIKNEQKLYSNIKQSEIPIILNENESEIITKNPSQGRESLQEDASATNQAEKLNENSTTQQDVVDTDQIYEEYKLFLNRENADSQRRPNTIHKKYKNDEYHSNAEEPEPEIQTEATYIVRRSNYQIPLINISTPDFSNTVKNELKKEASRDNDEFCGTHNHGSSTGRTISEADDMVEVFDTNHNEGILH